ncbi:MAG: helix-turn-helix domain-containing protein [Pseudomonadota bacterium]
MAWKFSLSNAPYKQKSNIKLVLIKLCDNASDEGYCWPSMGKIAKECELSKRSIVDQVSKLKDLGLVYVTHRFKDNEQTSNGYQINIELLSRGELLAPPSESASLPQCTVCTQNHHLTINEPSITDISKADERVFLEDIKFDYDLRFCQEAIDQIKHINKLNYCRTAYDGSLTLREWQDCEDVMRSIDDFDFEYFTWWMETRSQSMNKKPSLPNMLCDMNETTFEQFYNSTFMQEADL